MTESTVENLAQREPEPKIGPGIRLREAREARKLTVEATAVQLRIDPVLVTALEEDDYDKFAAPIFITGNIRAYARLLDLPPEPLLEAYHGLGHDVPPALKQVNRYPRLGSSTSWAPGVIALLLVAVAILAFLAWQSDGQLPDFSQEQKSTQEEDKTLLLPEAPESQVPQDVGGFDSGAGLMPFDGADVGREEEPAAPLAASPKETPAAPPAAAPRAEMPEPVVRSKLSLKVDRASWVEVRDATGRRLLYDLLDSGAVKILEGVPPFDVLLGFAPGVTLEFNGKLVDHRLYARQETARFRLGENGISSL